MRAVALLCAPWRYYACRGAIMRAVALLSSVVLNLYGNCIPICFFFTFQEKEYLGSLDYRIDEQRKQLTGRVLKHAAELQN